MSLKNRITVIITLLLLLCTSVFITGATINNNGSISSIDSTIFSDVTKSDWFCEDVRYVQENALMNGISETEFSPFGLTTRGMIATILWRLEGEPIEVGKNFDDVSKDAYYYNAIAWALNNKIVNGYSETIFAPNDTATRDQLTTIMYRYASYKKYDISKEAELDKYVDKDQISEYAVKSIRWANANGIISGTSANTLSPKDNVQRCQVAAILKRFCTKVADYKKDDDDGYQLSEKESDNKEDNTNKQSYSVTGEVPQPTEASLTPTIIVDQTTAKPGDEIELYVSIRNNPGILGMILTIYFDDNYCVLESVQNGDALKNILDLTTSKDLTNGCRFVWDGVEITDKNIKDGSLLLLKFKIKDNAPQGVCPVTIKYFNDDIIDNNLEGVYPVVKNGEITVIK